MVRRLFSRLLRVLGYDVAEFGGAGWLVQRSDAGVRDLQVRGLDNRNWLVQRGKSRSLRRIGSAKAKAHLVVNDRAARTHMPEVQRALSGYLAHEQAAWVLRDRDVNCVFDVGANVGQYAKALRRCGYRGRIVSFEPVSELAEKLRLAASDDPDWLVFQCAVGDEEGTMSMNVAPGAHHGAGTMSSLLPSSDFGQEWSSKLRMMTKQSVPVRRLDSMYEEAVAGLSEPRVYLKMDTQGYDLRAFRGAGEYVNQFVGLQSEVSCVPIYDGMPHMLEQIAAYEDAGYSPAGIFQVSRHRTTLRIIEFDVVMVRAELPVEVSEAAAVAEA
jgi:FkbM family methyltransferase